MSELQTRTFDASDYLGSEDDILAYLQAAADEGDPLLLAAALGDVVKALGLKIRPGSSAAS